MTLISTLHKATSLLLVLLFTSTAYGSIGAVSKLKGTGVITRTDGNDVDLSKDLDVFSYDEVKTGNGRTSIDFVDDTRVEITEHSKLVIDDFVYDPANNEGGLTLTAAFGTVKYASGQIAKDHRDNVKIQTPTATIGVRGTDFAMIVDEIGGSTIILLPSCDTNGNCLVGEISVESDAGFVIMNQAFQATRVEAAESKPFKPISVDIDESMISNLLILSPPKELDPNEQRGDVEERADLLNIDFLEIDVLNEDLLATEESDTFTELDIDYLAGDFLADVLDQINKVLAAQFLEELGDVFVEKEQKTGQLEGGIIVIDDGNNWIFSRQGPNNYVRLVLNKRNQYQIDLEQSDFLIREFIVGDGGVNNINIYQR
jgi:SAM-dependent methyltransferase